MQLRTLAALLLAGLLSIPLLPAQNATGSGAATLVSLDNRVQVSGADGAWSSASAGRELQIGDRIKTGEDSRATVRMADGSVLQLDELTTIEIKAPKEANSSATLNVPSGATYFFNRGRSREVRVETPSANGAIRGTAFLLTVDRADGGTAVAMITGAFELSNSGGQTTARQGERASAGAAGLTKQTYGDLGDTAPWYLVLENQLPAVQSLRQAGKAPFLGTLPSAIKLYRHVAPQLSGAATIVRKEWALDILRTAFEAVGPDCGMRARILRSMIAADPEDAARLTELAIALGPGCAGAFGGGGGRGGDSRDGFGNTIGLDNNVNPPPFGGGGGGQGNLVVICHQGQTIFLSPQDAERHLRDHSGDTLGACQVTPVTNR